MSRSTTLLYLHGFLSSPQSKKAQQAINYCQQTQCVDRVIVPTLQWGPAAAMSQLHAIVLAEADQDLMLIGSSLGGFYATCIADKYGVPAALINPAVGPFERWETYLGSHQNYYSDEVHTVTRTHIKELESLDVAQLTIPENFLLLVETADETLDYRKAVDKYAAATQIVHAGGSHSYENFSADLPVIFQFLLSRIT